MANKKSSLVRFYCLLHCISSDMSCLRSIPVNYHLLFRCSSEGNYQESVCMCMWARAISQDSSPRCNTPHPPPHHSPWSHVGFALTDNCLVHVNFVAVKTRMNSLSEILWGVGVRGVWLAFGGAQWKWGLHVNGLATIDFPFFSGSSHLSGTKLFFFEFLLQLSV